MKIECMQCETIYDVSFGRCTTCLARGGYMQEPRSKEIGKLNIHLKGILLHIESGNEYQVKEIQKNGLIVVLRKSPLGGKTLRAYISNSSIGEYTTK